MSSSRIVLVESTGDVLFEGRSLLSEPPPPVASEDESYDVDLDDADACPPTMRSAQESGIFPTVTGERSTRAA